MTRTLTSRRSVLKGLAGLSVLAAGGVVYRAWDNGVFDVGGGPAYEPWHDWREAALEGPLAIVQAGILASNAHNTQPWRFGSARIASPSSPITTAISGLRSLPPRDGAVARLRHREHGARGPGAGAGAADRVAPDRFGLGGPSRS
jgi:hypothetical protein